MNSSRSASLIVGLVLSTVSAVVLAGEQTGKVTSLLTRDSDGLVYVTLDGAATGKPACARNGYWMVKNEISESGKRQYSLLMAAMIAGKTVLISGSNACTRWSDGEDINYILVKNN